MSARHPLTDLALEELPGWIACSGYVTARLRKEDCEAETLADILHELQQVAEGLMANAANEERADEPIAAAANAPQPTRVKRASPPARKPGSSRGPFVTVWTEDRKTLFAELWPTEMMPGAILVHINALSGLPVSGVNALHQHAIKRKIRREGMPIPARFLPTESEAPPAARPEAATVDGGEGPDEEASTATVEPSPELADAAVVRQHARLRAALAEDKDPQAVARRHSVPLHLVLRIAGELRREKAAA